MKRSARFKLKLGGITKDFIDLGLLDKFLAWATLRSEMPTVERLLDSDGLYVVTATLKAPSLDLETESGDLVETEFEIPDVGYGASGGIEISAEAKKTDSIAFKANVPVVFAFQAVSLRYEDGHYISLQPDRRNLTLMGDDDADEHAGRVPTAHRRVQIGG
jgi:hypothetical protein